MTGEELYNQFKETCKHAGGVIKNFSNFVRCEFENADIDLRPEERFIKIEGHEKDKLIKIRNVKEIKHSQEIKEMSIFSDDYSFVTIFNNEKGKIIAHIYGGIIGD